MSQAQVNALRSVLIQAVEAAGFSLSGPTDIRAAENGEPVWVCNAREVLASTSNPVPATASADAKLKTFEVMLREDPECDQLTGFRCQAEDDEHAIEQTSDAYPDSDIITIRSFDTGQPLFVVYSADEAKADPGSGFWSNKDGWTTIDGACLYSLDDLPVSLPSSFKDGKPPVLMSYTVAMQQENLRHAVAVVIDCMLQDDARGQTIVFTRENGVLMPSTVSADTIELDALGQYEAILFDGGNSAGDLWKHVFFPQQCREYFVDENPICSGQAHCLAVWGSDFYQEGAEAVTFSFFTSERGYSLGDIEALQNLAVGDVWQSVYPTHTVTRIA